MEEKFYELALSLLPGVGPLTYRNLISYYGTAKTVFESQARHLRKTPGLRRELIDPILNQSSFQQAEQELNYCMDNGIDIIYFTEESFPVRLNQFNSSPPILFSKGETDLNAQRMIGIVGTRSPSPYGKIQCSKIVEGLTRFQCGVVSGLAFGIDIIAHSTCIDRNMPTIAVIASGIDRISPLPHLPVARKIENNGCIVTEYPSGTIADKERFPMRNRIIAGMIDALLVIESGKRGGSMISAEFAFSFDREVLALPGRVNDDKSAGCLALIHKQKASIVRNADDRAIHMGWDENGLAIGTQGLLFPKLDETEQVILDILNDYPAINIDLLLVKTGVETGKLANTLLMLEFKGLIKPIPRKRYIKIL